MRMLIPFAFAALLALAPQPVQADDPDTKPACPDGQVETPEGCSQQAWVDDCPPDMLCAAGGSDGPIAYGNESCIKCSGVADPGPSPDTCMDGADAGESCDGDVQYFGPGPADTGIEPDAQPEAISDEDAGKEAPVLPLAVLLVALVGLVALSRRR